MNEKKQDPLTKMPVFPHLGDLSVPKISIWRRQWHPTPVLLPGKSHGWSGLVGWSPWGLKESDRTEWLHFHFSSSCIGEGNGNPLQCSCLENPRDGGACWAAVYGVAQSRTQLKRLSSSSSSKISIMLLKKKIHTFYLRCLDSSDGLQFKAAKSFISVKIMASMKG